MLKVIAPTALAAVSMVAIYAATAINFAQTAAF